MVVDQGRHEREGAEGDVQREDRESKCELSGMSLLTVLISSRITQKKHCQVLF